MEYQDWLGQHHHSLHQVSPFWWFMDISDTTHLNLASAHMTHTALRWYRTPHWIKSSIKSSFHFYPAQSILILHIFIPHYSFHLVLLCTFLSLTSPFPVTNITFFRTIEQVRKEVPIRVISNSLLSQAMVTYLRIRVLSLDLSCTWVENSILCSPPSRWSIVSMIPCSTLISVFPSQPTGMSSPKWYGLWGHKNGGNSWQ